MDTFWDLFKKNFVPFLSPYWDNIALWRSLTLGSIALVLIGYKYRYKLAAYIAGENFKKHDKKVFETLQKVLIEEEIEDITETLANTYQISEEQFAKLKGMREAMIAIENYYLDKRISKKSFVLYEHLMHMMNAINHGFEYDSNAKVLRLLNNKHWAKHLIDSHALHTQYKYRLYRLEIKKVLLI